MADADDASTASAAKPFALTPGQSTNEVIDYTTKVGSDGFKAATAPLSKTEYDCKDGQLRDMMEQLENRAFIYGWSGGAGICDVPKDIHDPTGESQDIFTTYGQEEMNLERLRAHVAANIAGKESRAAQDDVALYVCLFASLSETGRNTVTIHKKRYIVNGHKSGLLLLKIIIRESYIDTNATLLSIRKKFLHLDDYLISVNYDIEKLNAHVMMLLEGLRARGADTTDLLANLFKAYAVVKDKDFVKYITNKEDEYEEGSSEMTPQELMDFAKTKYAILKEKGTWNAPTEEEEKILALQTEVNKLKTESKKAAKAQNKNSGGGSGGNKAKKDKKDKDKDQSYISWKKVPPKDGEPWTKEKTGRTWNWCEHHKFWTVSHSSKNCEVGKKKKEKGSKAQDNKKAKLVSALKTVIEDGDSSDDE